MQDNKKPQPKVKSNLHPRYKHRERYDFKQLFEVPPELAQYVRLNDYQDEAIDFFNPVAVKALNRALLKRHIGINNWDIPRNYLCPAIPGRADYIHHIADLLGKSITKSGGMKIPVGTQIRYLDLGVGANCVYPIIGISEYGWSFVGADIDPAAIESANRIIESNPSLTGKLELRLQSNSQDIFRGIIQKDEYFDLSICNAPFHASLAEAQARALRKIKNIREKRASKPVLNFGGQSSELWYEGEEEKFVQTLISQSREFSTSCFWYSSFISKESNLIKVYKSLEYVQATEVKTIPMAQGNKTSRIVAWTFLNPKQQQIWVKAR